MAHKGRDQQPARLAGAGGEGESGGPPRQGGMRAAGVAAGRVAAPILSRHRGVLARLKAHWTAAVGDDVALLARPEGLGRDGALKLRVAPGLGLDVQHRAPLMIERINRFFGHPAVSRLVLVQGPLPLAPPPAAPPVSLSTAEKGALAARVAAVADPLLRAALARLGEAVTVAARTTDPACEAE